MNVDLELSLPNYGTESHTSEEIIPEAEPIAACWGKIRVLSVAIILPDIFHFYAPEIEEIGGHIVFVLSVILSYSRKL